MILLDTNTVIALLNRNPNARFRERDARSRGETFAVPAVVAFELEYGVRRSHKQAENARELALFLAQMRVLAFDHEDAAIAADIRAYLDLLIAAQSLRHNAALITANTTECRRVPGLAWQDWSQPA